MTFEFEGTQFRILFQRDPSRRLEDHVNHEVYLTSQMRRGNHAVKPLGPAYLVCGTCTSRLKLRAPFRLTSLNRADRQRKTCCVIAEKDAAGEWVIGDLQGVGVPHPKHDQFTLQGGRKAAFRDALSPQWVSKPFRTAAWAAFFKATGAAPSKVEAQGK